MPSTILPSKNPAALKKFNELLAVQDMSMMIIYGSDKVALDARVFAGTLDESGAPEYEAVNFVMVDSLDLIIDAINKLPTPKIDLAKLSTAIGISLSPTEKIPAYLLSIDRYNHAKGYMKRAIIEAMAIG